ncbi:serine/threonine-protein kinase-like protein At5g23170 [Euphorbia lathyris]|uniref:serine/threonine-protein kinase-like protein At5g23170 n=1 Tax=Euphorbia lathyris TaxID=212925 RepID=UPI003313D1B0
MAEFEYHQIVKATEGFSPSNLIGKGSHGSIYKASFLQQNTILAIKKPSFGYHNDNYNKLENEIFVLSSLPPSPYIIPFIGTTNNHNKLLVMEFMPNGSLYDLLHLSKTPPSWPKRLEIALQLARAIQFLHEGKPSVIHRDIKSANVLFDSTWNAKLADYGLAVSQLSQLTTQPAGTIGYMDPCYSTPCKLSTKNDVFSYGVVLLEIFSSKKAIDMSSNPASIVEWAVPLIKKRRLDQIYDRRIGSPPELMEGTVKHLLYMAARCVSLKEENRPSISDIVGVGVVERVKVGPSWTSLLRKLIHRKFGKKKCSGDDDHKHNSKGKILLMELLADISF